MDCQHCKGSGLVKTPESASIEIMREIHMLAGNQDVATINVTTSPEVASFLLNSKRATLNELEATHDTTITIQLDRNIGNDEVDFVTRNRRGSVIEQKR